MKRFVIGRGVLAICGLLLAAQMPAAFCADSAEVMQAAEARSEVARQLEMLQKFQADFTQTVTDARGELVEQSAGRFWLSRPSRFRWEYLTPWPRLIVADGGRIWLYDEELEQVTVKNFSGVLEHTPAALLAGRSELLKDYTVSGERNGKRICLRLVPQGGQSDFREIELVFEADVLTEMRLQDSFNQQTRIVFSGITTSPGFGDSTFTFTVPPGADLIDESGGQE